MLSARVVLTVVLLVACAALGVGVVAFSDRAPAGGSAPTPVPDATDGPIAVLREWDRRRAAAWAAGDVEGLRSLYLTRSVAGERDAARLSRWLDQDLRVRRLVTQVLRVRVLEARRGALLLAVTDRIARAETTSGLQLPSDDPSTWRIRMRRVVGEWRVAAVSRRAS